MRRDHGCSLASGSTPSAASVAPTPRRRSPRSPTRRHRGRRHGRALRRRRARPTSSGICSATAASPSRRCRRIGAHFLRPPRRHPAALGRAARRRRPVRRGVLRRLAARSRGHGSAAAAVPRGGVGRARGRRLPGRRARCRHRRVRRRDVRRLRVSAPTSVAKAPAIPYRCWEGFSLANRLSQLLGFRGPSLAVDTACSSSGTALHLACRALQAGDCRVAIVGGVNLILDPDRFVQLGRLGILSQHGALPARSAPTPTAPCSARAPASSCCGRWPTRSARRPHLRRDQGHGLSTGSGTVGFTAPNPAGAGGSDPPRAARARRRSADDHLRRDARHRHRARRSDRGARPDARLRRPPRCATPRSTGEQRVHASGRSSRTSATSRRAPACSG